MKEHFPGGSKTANRLLPLSFAFSPAQSSVSGQRPLLAYIGTGDFVADSVS
ncbi:MAG: hypothetical protein IJF71_04325 [Clostridia bacterium]|nr:hypothetical protein [Clostridia bacterium]